MLKCQYCKAPLPNNEGMCEYCNMYNKEQIVKQEIITQQSKTPQEIEQNKKQSKILSIISLIIALPMYLLSFKGALNNPEMSTLVGFIAMVMLYSMTIGIIPHIIGTIISIISLKKDKTNIIAKVSLVITILPYAFLIAINLFGLITYYITK